MNIGSAWGRLARHAGLPKMFRLWGVLTWLAVILAGGGLRAQVTGPASGGDGHKKAGVRPGLSIEEKERLSRQHATFTSGEWPDPGDSGDKVLQCSPPCTSGTLMATNTFYDVFLDCDDGAFTARTGAGHSVTVNSGSPQNVIFGGSTANPWSSEVSFYIHDNNTHYINPSGGAACLFDPPDTPKEPNSTGIEAEWTRSPMAGANLTLREEIVSFGDTEPDSGIRLTLGVTNEASSTRSVTVGVRWQIDYQNGGDDGPLIALVRCIPFGIGPDSRREHQFLPSEILDFYRIQNNSGSPVFGNFTSTTSLTGFPDTFTPDRLIYGYWPSLSGSGWNYSANEGSTAPDADSAVLYYYGYAPADAVVIAPGESFTRSAILFTSGEAQDCQVFYECAALAGEDVEICQGESADLNGSASNFSDCPGAEEYRWLDGGVPVRDWSTDPTVTVTPAATTTYTLEIHCLDGGEVACESSDEVTVMVHPLPEAVASPDVEICNGDSVDLDGSGSLFPGCSGDREVQWLVGGTPVQSWTTNPVLTVSPSATTTYTLQVRCSEATGLICEGAEDAVAVVVDPMPSAAAGDDLTVCENEHFRIDGSGSAFPECPGTPEYRWSRDGTPLTAWRSLPGLSLVAGSAGLENYTLEVRCGTYPDCVGSDALQVTVEECPQAVEFSGYGARATAQGVVVTWTTVSEVDTLGFVVEGRNHPAEAPALAHHGMVGAAGSGSVYTVPVDRPYFKEYRIREIAVAGSPSATPFFPVEGGPERVRGTDGGPGTIGRR